MGNSRSAPTPMLIVGLDAAGKTTLMFHLAKGKVTTQIPTIGFHMEQAEFQGFTATSFDLGGRCPMRPLYRHFLRQKGLVVMMVVDANDPERFEDAKRELNWFAGEETMERGIFVILANKSDLPGASPVDEVASVLKPTQRHAIFPTCMTTMEGVQDALDWVKRVQSEGTAPPEPANDEKKALASKDSTSLVARLLTDVGGAFSRLRQGGQPPLDQESFAFLYPPSLTMGNSRSAPTPMLIVGLDAAGKTTLMFHLAKGKVTTQIPTIGFHMEQAEFQGFTATSFDLGGRCPMRPLYRHFLRQEGLVVMMVVDANDPERFEDAKRELNWFAGEETMERSIFVILANKRDLPGASPVDEVASVLKPTQRYAIFPTCITTMKGVQDALDWVKSVHRQDCTEGTQQAKSAEDTAPPAPTQDEKQRLASKDPGAPFGTVLKAFFKGIL
eukprot:CAMPEP_0204393262 /NCGR_PEP_ID=MMETSP0469-20131031/62224_1 /ASSEMBLY_ACC=CAM_ASM_000384 /TAXON_ID=2969 /ORGANISM="Oxyrrhis marina" /LENGTH=443 /DNA_ID=CAMNT_0051387321 /DNA_START=57 /DNA_END=1389 /DNA_ORIENTATION=-